MHKHFGRQAVIALTRVSRSQVEHWAKLGIVRPSLKCAFGKGTRREYSFVDLIQFRVAKALREEGINLPQIKKSLTYLRKNLHKDNVDYNELNTWFVFGKKFNLLTKDINQIFNMNRKKGEELFFGNNTNSWQKQEVSREFFCALPIGEIIKEIEEALEKFSTPQKTKVKVKGQDFNIILTPDLEDGGYTVQCKEIPAAISQGESEAEALDNIIDAIELCLEKG